MMLLTPITTGLMMMAASFILQPVYAWPSIETATSIQVPTIQRILLLKEEEHQHVPVEQRFSSNSVRAEAYQILRQALPRGQRSKSEQFISKLRTRIQRHTRLHQHPVLHAMYDGQFTKSQLAKLHLDFRALVIEFTDYITAIAQNVQNLRTTHGNEVGFAARFLVFLNLLDELGFEAGNHQYAGTPRGSHFLLFEDVLTDLGVDMHDRDNSKHLSEPTRLLKEKLQNNKDDLLTLLLYLIVTEEEAVMFSPAMRGAVESAGVNVDSGYYMVHGTSDDVETNACDDLHQNDVWEILSLLVVDEDNYKKAARLADEFLDLWCSFWDHQLRRLSE